MRPAGAFELLEHGQREVDLDAVLVVVHLGLKGASSSRDLAF